MSTVILGSNSNDVVADVVEGDAVLINVATGIYYCTKGIGGWVWELIAEDAGLEEIVQAIVAAYNVSEEVARADLGIFLSDLRRESLVIEKPASDSSRTITAQGTGAAYCPPELIVYRDLKDLLALDPPMPRMAG